MPVVSVQFRTERVGSSLPYPKRSQATEQKCRTIFLTIRAMHPEKAAVNPSTHRISKRSKSTQSSCHWVKSAQKLTTATRPRHTLRLLQRGPRQETESMTTATRPRHTLRLLARSPLQKQKIITPNRSVMQDASAGNRTRGWPISKKFFS